MNDTFSKANGVLIEGSSRCNQGADQISAPLWSTGCSLFVRGCEYGAAVFEDGHREFYGAVLFEPDPRHARAEIDP